MSSERKILVVEDDPKISQLISGTFTENGYVSRVARDGTAALKAVESEHFDAVVLDIMLPGIDGYAVLKHIRKINADLPVIMLTAMDGVGDRVRGLDAGADDYIVKPFAVAELLARLRAVMRRSREKSEMTLEYGGLRLDCLRREVERDGERVELTAREFDLLEYFMRNPEHVLTRSMILQKIWGYNFDGMSNVVDVYINYIRNKIDTGKHERLLQTVRGVGYKLQKECQ